MPAEEEVLGFSNRWYQAAISAANTYAFSEELTVRLVTGPCFLATKLEAFLERGDGDYQLSHDIEDVIAVVDGRTELLDEIESADPDVRDYLQQKVSELLSDERFRNAVPGHMPGDAGSQARVPAILARLEQIAGNRPLLAHDPDILGARPVHAPQVVRHP